MGSGEIGKSINVSVSSIFRGSSFSLSRHSVIPKRLEQCGVEHRTLGEFHVDFVAFLLIHGIDWFMDIIILLTNGINCLLMAFIG